MELKNLKGNIIGVITNEYQKIENPDKLVSELITKKVIDSMRMVNLDIQYINESFSNLSSKNQQRLLLASQLNNDVIILYNFSNSFINRELIFYKNLFKKLVKYNKKIIIVSNDIDFFVNLVDNLYVINKDVIEYSTNDFYDLDLYKYINKPKIIEIVDYIKEKNIKIDNYLEFNELLKAMYRLKS